MADQVAPPGLGRWCAAADDVDLSHLDLDVDPGPATSVSRPASAGRIYPGAMPAERSSFRMGRLDHVHVRVPDRAEAARWYAEHLGFEPVDAYDFWATGFEGGPLQISADGGRTTLALFEATESHPMVLQQTGVAFSVDADTFMSFARSLPCEIDTPTRERLELSDLVDFDLCWAFELVDPWGNRYELNCYEYERVRAELVEAEGVAVVRYWPLELYAAHRDATPSEQGGLSPR
jgi:catechol 2,3-dioxygenase-like lactoylglutathione lyase family enzyme